MRTIAMKIITGGAALCWFFVSACQMPPGNRASDFIDEDAVTRRFDTVPPFDGMTVLVFYAGQHARNISVVDVAVRGGDRADHLSLATALGHAAVQSPAGAFVLLCDDGSQAKILSNYSPRGRVTVSVRTDPDLTIRFREADILVYRVHVATEAISSRVVSARLLRTFLGDGVFSPDAWPK